MVTVGAVIEPDTYAVEVYTGAESGDAVIVLVAKQRPLRIERGKARGVAENAMPVIEGHKARFARNIGERRTNSRKENSKQLFHYKYFSNFF